MDFSSFTYKFIYIHILGVEEFSPNSMGEFMQFLNSPPRKVIFPIFRVYTALGHKLRFFRKWKAQFVAVGII